MVIGIRGEELSCKVVEGQRHYNGVRVFIINKDVLIQLQLGLHIKFNLIPAHSTVSMRQTEIRQHTTAI